MSLHPILVLPSVKLPFMFFLSCVCYAFVRVCLYVPCGYLLGKGWSLGSRLWCITVSLSLSHWYPGSGVVLDCIDSWSLHPNLLYLHSPAMFLTHTQMFQPDRLILLIYIIFVKDWYEGHYSEVLVHLYEIWEFTMATRAIVLNYWLNFHQILIWALL